jgi:phosphoribosyl 1,2-cyclic phosphodiesterase
VKVTFYGVRGSTPCPASPYARYGGNTSCVVIDAPGEEPIICDMGTGLRSWGETQPLDGTFRATALVTHFHFDHVQGLPFLAAADRPGSRLDIYGPGRSGTDVTDQFTQFVRPPFFPVTIDQLRGTYRCVDIADEVFSVGSAKVRSRAIPHVGLTLGFRIEHEGCSVAYIPDHQAPHNLQGVDESVLELADGVDLLIHDAQYIDADWEAKAHWGHSTIEYAIEVAAISGAKALALFHHDPSRSDDEVDRLAAAAQRLDRGAGIDIFAAAENLRIDLTKPVKPQTTRRVTVGPMFGGSLR